MEINLPMIAGFISTALFTLGTLPMLTKAFRTRNLASYSLGNILMSNEVLPPVELIRTGGIYFVRDGHHRISVARALGEAYIDAEVIDQTC